MVPVRLTVLAVIGLLQTPMPIANGEADTTPSADTGGEQVRARTACGAPGRPPCPLQKWMRHELAGPRYGGDWERLARNFEALAAANPEPKEWSRWTQYAERGARAARAKSRRDLDSQCRNCHKQYRRPYKKRHRLRPPPSTH